MHASAPSNAFAAALASITLLGPLAVHLFLPLMPSVQREFAISTAAAGAAFSITLATMAVATLAYGSLSDRYGRRPVLLGGLALFLCGSALCLAAGSITTLFVGRLLQAAGAGVGLTLSRAIARDVYGPDQLVKVIAYITMAYALGPMLAPPLGGVLNDTFGWRAGFALALGAGLAVGLAAYRILREARPVAARTRSAPLLGCYWALLREPVFDSFVLQTGFRPACSSRWQRPRRSS